MNYAQVPTNNLIFVENKNVNKSTTIIIEIIFNFMTVYEYKITNVFVAIINNPMQSF